MRRVPEGSDSRGVGPAAASAPAGAPASLDERTQLVEPGPWRVSAYPECGEATITWCSDTGDSDAWSTLDEDERQRLNHLRANRRAEGQSRRYMVRNGLRYMWVLTFAEGRHGVDGRRDVMAAVAGFVKQLRTDLGGEAFPYWYSPELHPGGHGWHVNFFVGARLAHPRMAHLWGHGFVWVTDWGRDRKGPRGEQLRELNSVREGIRRGAGYGCKYASKDWSVQVLESGAHRFEVAQGFNPAQVVRWCRQLNEALGSASMVMGGEVPTSTWRSDDSSDWNGPPVWVLTWALDDG